MNGDRLDARQADFLFQERDGAQVVVEVKGEHPIDGPVVQAKQAFAEQMATASRMRHRMRGGNIGSHPTVLVPANGSR